MDNGATRAKQSVPGTRFAHADDCTSIHRLAGKVQSALTMSGSLQIIAPLQDVETAILERRILVLDDREADLGGCVFFRSLVNASYPGTELDVTAFPEPRIVLHSLMLAPDAQGKGFGLHFFDEVMQLLQSRARSVLLDCWAGNSKLRTFYRRAGCELVGIAPEADYEIVVFVRVLGASAAKDMTDPT